MKSLINIFITVILFVLMAVSCEQDINNNVKDCSSKVDSVNTHWTAIVKALMLSPKDTIKVIITKDTTVYHYKDTTLYTFQDSTILIYKDSVVITYRDSLRIKDSIRIVEEFQSLPSVEIKIDSVLVDSYYTTMPASNMLDNKLYQSKSSQGTRWGQSGYPHQAMFWFDTTYVVTGIWINTYGWNEDYTHSFKVYHFSDLILSSITSSELWSKHSLFYTGNHLYLEIIGGKNSWTDIAEVKVFGYKLN